MRTRYHPRILIPIRHRLCRNQYLKANSAFLSTSLRSSSTSVANKNVWLVTTVRRQLTLTKTLEVKWLTGLLTSIISLNSSLRRFISSSSSWTSTSLKGMCKRASWNLSRSVACIWLPSMRRLIVSRNLRICWTCATTPTQKGTS